MEQILLFIITFLLTYFLYYFFIIRKELVEVTRKNGKKKKTIRKQPDRHKVPVEIAYLMGRYQISFVHISYSSVLYTIAWVGSLVISIVVTIISFIDGFVWQMLTGFVLLLPLTYVAFWLVGLYYQKKGRKNS